MGLTFRVEIQVKKDLHHKDFLALCYALKAQPKLGIQKLTGKVK